MHPDKILYVVKCGNSFPKKVKFLPDWETLVYGMWPNFEMHGSMRPRNILLSFFVSDLKVFSKGVVQIICKNKLSRKCFPILLDIKAK